jgi:hypothetical protein
MFAARARGGIRVQVVGRPQARASTKHPQLRCGVFLLLSDLPNAKMLPRPSFMHARSTSATLRKLCLHRASVLSCPEPEIFIFPALSLLDAVSLLVVRRSGAHIPSCDPDA